MKRYGWALLALLWTQGGVLAQEQNASEESLEPEIIITPSVDNQIKEYRVNGQLYMIEITPAKGAPYYLVDTDGDGQFDTHRNVGQEIVIPRWILLRW